MKEPSRSAPRLVWPDLSLLFVLALLIRLLAALPQQQPGYMDAAYSYVNALNLAAGRGFVEDFVWLYLDNPAPPPQPSHLYWLPLTSILAWLGLALGGTTYRAAQIPFILGSAMLAPLTYLVTHALSAHRWQCWLAGLLAIFSGFYFPFWTAIDNFTPFAVAGSLALLAAWWAMKNEAINNSPFTIHHSQLVFLILSGICLGLAHLSRADGPLLLVAIGIAYAFWTFNIQPDVQTHLRFTQYLIRFICLLLGYLFVMTPWFIRNWQVVGAPLPTAGSQTIWLTNYDELYSYGRVLSAQTFLAQGLGSILRGRWWVLTTNLQTVLAGWGMVFVLPLALPGFWQLRRHLLLQLAATYALLLFITMTLVFAFPGARGGLFHSGAAVLPYLYATAVVGLDVGVDWLAARRRSWKAPLAKRFLGAGLLVLAMLVSGLIYYQRVIKNNAWNNADALYPAIAAWVSDQNPTATVMINNPPAYRYHGGGLSVVIPNENIDTTLQAARRYGVDYLILEPNHPAPLADIYAQTITSPQLSLVKTFDQIYIYKIIQP